MLPLLVMAVSFFNGNSGDWGGSNLVERRQRIDGAIALSIDCGREKIDRHARRHRFWQGLRAPSIFFFISQFARWRRWLPPSSIAPSKIKIKTTNEPKGRRPNSFRSRPPGALEKILERSGSMGQRVLSPWQRRPAVSASRLLGLAFH